jgi:hypothetical protein
VKPVVQALVLAEHVYQDVTGKKVIAGTFNQIGFKHKLPAVQERKLPDGTSQQVMLGGMHGGSPYAYISLTDVCDGVELVLQFVNLSKNQVLFGKKMAISCDDRLKTIEIVAPLPPLPVDDEGTYAFEVVCDGEILGSHRILARELDI